MQVKLSVDQALMKARSHAKKGEFLESQNYDLIESVSFLKKSNNYQWDELEKDSRRAEIQQTIKVIERRV